MAGHYPPTLIQILMLGLVGVGDGSSNQELSVEYMDEIHGDMGCPSEHSIMALLNMQYGMQIDGVAVQGADLPPSQLPNGMG